MVKTILSASHCNLDVGTTVAGTTEFWLFGYASFEKNATESTREITYRAPGTLSKLYVRITANSTSASSTVTIRKNAADTALSVTIGAAATGEFEDADSVSVAAGDKLCIKTVSGGTGTFTMTMVSCIWDATTNCNVRYVAKGYSVNQASATNYLPIAGDRSGTTGTEANVENTIKTAGTIKNGSVNVTANARTNNTVFAVRKNRADTTMVITVAAGVTGHREDTTNSISYVVDNELDWRLTTLTGTPALAANSFAVDYETTTNQGVLTRGCIGTTGDYIVNANVTWYAPIGAGNLEGVTTESQVQMKAREAFTFRNLVAYISPNTISADTVINFRVNGANSGITLTIGPAVPGFFADTTNTVTVAAGDLIDFQIVAGATGTNLSLRQLGITTEISAGNNVVRAVPTETIALSDSRVRLAAKTRTRTETAIAIGETRARLSAKMRPIATQTVALSENAVRVKGKVKSLATEIITIGGGTIARLLAKIRIASDTTTISENRQRLGSKSRQLPIQSLALSESVQRIKAAIKAVATQTVIIGAGSIARLSAKSRALATQTVAIAEDLQKTIAAGAQNIVKTITQTITLGESIARLKASQRLTSQTIIVGAGTIARLSSKIRAIPQTIVLADNRTRLAAKIRSLTLQTVSITDNRARIKGAVKTVSQTIIITENRNRIATKLRALSAQTVVIADSVARQIIGGPVEIIRALSETVALSGTVARLTAVQRLLSENVPKAETLARVRGVSRILSQTVLVTEQLARIKSSLRLLSQTVSASESLNRLNALRRTVSQTILTAENVAQETVGNLVRSIVETVTVSDNIARRTAKLVILDQFIVIAEQASRISEKLRVIPAETIFLADSVTNELNVIIKHIIKTISQATTITEHLKLEVVKKSQRFRKITTPSNWRLKSNHPAWFLGTRGQHDHYEEFS